MRRPLLGLLLIASVLLAGCANAASHAAARPDAQREVRALAVSFEHAVATDDFAQVCDDLTVARRHSIVKEVDQAVPSVASCEEAVNLAAGSKGRAAAKATVVERVRVRGNRATIYRRQHGQTTTAGVTK